MLVITIFFSGARDEKKTVIECATQIYIAQMNTRTPKERGADRPKITCLNCKHLMFSDMYGECNKQLKIVNLSDTCEYAEPKERGGRSELLHSKLQLWK